MYGVKGSCWGTMVDLRNPLAVKVVIFPRFELEVEFPLALFVIRNSLGNESDVLSWAYAASKTQAWYREDKYNTKKGDNYCSNQIIITHVNLWRAFFKTLFLSSQAQLLTRKKFDGDC